MSVRGYEIVLMPAAIVDLDRLRKYDAVWVAEGIEKFLTHRPTQVSKTGIKKLRGVTDPDYRLRIRDFRIFYNVDEEERKVWILRVLHKVETEEFYREVKP